LRSRAYGFSRNAEFRVFNDSVQDEQGIEHDAWNEWLDSRTFVLYGGRNGQGLCRFKIDHDLDIGFVDQIVGQKGLFLGDSLPIDKGMYDASQGTEFVILQDDKLIDGTFAVRSDKFYATIGSNGAINYGALDLAGLGVFRINAHLDFEQIFSPKQTAEETYVHQGWLELLVGRNNASDIEYVTSLALLSGYLSRVADHGFFQQDETAHEKKKGMGFFVETRVSSYRARPFSLGRVQDHSDAIPRYMNFTYKGHLLKDVV
jgi:hypothetical protein